MVHGIFRPWSAPRPVVMNKTVMVNQQCHHSGGSGFWGGFLGGFLGTGLMNMGSLFGFGGMPMMGGGMFGSMPMMGGMSPMGYLNQNQGLYSGQQQGGGNGLATLKSFYGDNYDIAFENGKYYAKTKDGNSIISADSFEEMISKLGGTAPASVDPRAAEIAKQKLAAQSLGRIYETQQEIQAFNKLPADIRKGAMVEVIKEQGDEFAQYKVTREDGTAFIADDMTTIYARLGLNMAEVQKALEDSAAEEDAVVETPEAPTNKPESLEKPPKPAGAEDSTPTSTGTDVEIPDGWNRIDSEDVQVYSQSVNATHLVQILLGDKINRNTNTDKLTELIIKSNPSVFNADGTVKDNADWNELKLPSAEYLQENAYTVVLNKWSGREDPGFGKDQQFVAANGNIYEIIGGAYNNHLNKMWFNQSGIENGTSISIKNSYSGGIKYIENQETGKQFPVEYSAGGKDGNGIVVLVDEQRIPLEEFLNGDYDKKDIAATSLAEQIEESGADDIIA